MRSCVAVGLLAMVGLVSAPARADIFCAGQGSFATHASLQAAVAAAAANGPAMDTIRLDTLTFTQTATVVIENQSVEVVGGFVQCQPLAPTGVTTVQGNGTGTVIAVRVTDGSTQQVAFDRVRIRNGNGTIGGGLALSGATLSVVLRENVEVRENAANLGGGIAVDHATLSLAGASVNTNLATTLGGGIYCDRGTLTMDKAASVTFNQAATGGGIMLDDECEGEFNGGNPLSLTGNTATGAGGGMALAEFSRASVYRVNAFGLPPQPVSRAQAFQVRGNTARLRGAGIAVGGSSQLVAGGIVVADNVLTGVTGSDTEPVGAAIHGAGNSQIVLVQDAQCLPGESCNLVSGNVVNRNGTNFQGGGAIVANVGQRVELYATEIADNGIANGTALATALIVTNTPTLILDRVLMHGNGPTDASEVGAVIGVASVGTATFDYVTIADNTFNGASPRVLTSAPPNLTWRASIVDQPGATIFPGVAAQPAVDCLLANELTTAPSATRSLVGTPVFVNRAGGDYTPAAGSPQVDYCTDPSAPDPRFDLALQPVPSDLITVDVFGPYDLGALERQGPPNLIFANGFE